MKIGVTLVVICGVITGVLVGFGIRWGKPPNFQGRTIPPEGLLQFPQSVNPGEPENAVRDFRKIYRALDAYRSVHKRLPSIRELKDVTKPLAPGIQLSNEVFENPDNKYRETKIEAGKMGPSPYIFTYYPANPKRISDKKYLEILRRFPGQQRAVYHKPGEKYSWVTTNIYQRTNSRVFPDFSITNHYSGFVVVLWCDGTVEKIPQSKQLYIDLDPRSKLMFLPGESGIPKDAKPITEWWKSQGKGNATWE